MKPRAAKISSYFRWWEVLLLAAGVLGLLGLVWGPRLTINYTSSVPRGLYRVTGVAPGKGDFTIVRDERILKFAAKRDYIISGTPIGKRVVATEGDRACVKESGVYINGSKVPHSRPLMFDSEGRRMPSLRRCRRLTTDEIFLMGDKRKSFDSRYFGAVTPDAPTLVPLFTSDRF